MQVSTSILSIKDNFFDNVKVLDQSGSNYIHLDIMDGLFVHNKTWQYDDIQECMKELHTPLDVHLMVYDLDYYINKYAMLKPDYITFHYEATKEVSKYISTIKDKNIKVGLSIKPNTKVDNIIPFLDKVDLVLIMSVEPGAGGQKFITNSCDKIKALKEIRELYNYNYLIEVDGGINSDTIKLVTEAGVDIVVSGSYITNSDNYQEQINTLKSEF